MAKLLTAVWSGRLRQDTPRPARSRATGEAGIGIPTALFVVLIVFALGATWARLGIHNTQASAHERGRELSVQAAEAGVNEAMSELSLDDAYSGGSGSLAGDTGDYEVTVEAMSTDPDDRRRLITATGYSDLADSTPVVRRLEAEVDLESTDGFDYALFGGAGDLDGDNRLTVHGDLYGRDGVALANNSDVNGDVVSPLWITTSGNTLITGDVQAGGDVTLEDSQTTVQGSVFSAGDVHVDAHVKGDVQAAGTVTVGNNGQVDGQIAEQSPPPLISEEGLPQFTWDPASYSPTPETWSSTSAFRDSWSSDVDAGVAFEGHHRIEDTATLQLDRKWEMGDDVTIVSDGKVEMSREVSSASSDVVELVVVSFSEDGIRLSNNMTMPDGIRVLLFAPNGPVVFDNLKHFTGVVYGESIDVGQNFTLTWSEVEVPGFSWESSTPVRNRVIVRVVREVAASAAS